MKFKLFLAFLLLQFSVSFATKSVCLPKEEFKNSFKQRTNRTFKAAKNASFSINATGNQIYCPQTSIKIVTDFTINDPDSNSGKSIFIQIASGYVNGEDTLILTGSHPSVIANWNNGTGKLTLSSPTGSSVSYTDLINAVKDIEFKNNSATPSGTRSFSITLGQANYLPSTKHYYQFVSNPGVSWGNAKRAAEASTYFGLQGYLATVTTLDEAKFVGEQLSGNGWLAGSDVIKEGEWKWQSGPEKGIVFWNGLESGYTTTFAYWNSYKEPDNGKIKELIKQPGVEDYTYITDPNNGQKGTWNDLDLYGVKDPANLNYPKGYIVEYGGMPGDTSPQIATSTSLTILSITSTIAPEICNLGSSILQATASAGTLNWYDTELGGKLLGTGANYTTPILNSTITYYVESTIAGCSTKRTAVEVKVNTIPTITTVEIPQPVCGSGIFFLKANASEGIINWFPTITGGQLLSSGSLYITPQISENTTFYAEANNNDCISLERTPFKIEIYPLPPVTDEQVALCPPNTVVLDANVSNMSYLWSTGETTQTIVVSATGAYTVDITSPAPENCTVTKKTTVVEHAVPEINRIDVNETTVTVHLNNPQTYFEYSIDGTNYQSSNVFFNVSGGLQTAYVREINYCTFDTQTFIVLSIPKFFTPNNDAYNDTWKVEGLINYPEAEVTIFDQYGKFITKLDLANQTWDGTYNKNLLPSSDYWYVLKLDANSPEKRGHFSLKR